MKTISGYYYCTIALNIVRTKVRVHNGENLWQYFWLEIRGNPLSLVNRLIKTIITGIIIIITIIIAKSFSSSYFYFTNKIGNRGGSRTAAASKMEHFVITVNGFQPLTIITQSSILDVTAILDPPLGNWYLALTYIISSQYLKKNLHWSAISKTEW